MEVKDEVKAKAAIVKEAANLQTYELNHFNNKQNEIQETNVNVNNKTVSNQTVQSTQQIDIKFDTLLNELSSLNQKVSVLQSNLDSLKDISFSNKELDAQIIKALKDLKQYALMFKQASLTYEDKLLKTSFSIAKKIIGIEISQNSAQIAKETIKNLMDKIQGASKISIHLNPKDYVVLKDELEVDPIVKIEQDSNVTAGGVVIASDLGNFDGNIEAKIESISQTLELIS